MQTRDSGGTGRNKSCFVISPIGEVGTDTRAHADLVLGQVVRPGLSSAGFEPNRSDEFTSTGPITESVIDRLCCSPLCVAIIFPKPGQATELNPNVMYEIGIRHAWALPLICIALEGTQLPFDIKDHRTIFYSLDKLDAAKQSLEVSARTVSSIANVGMPTNGISLAFMNAIGACNQRFALDLLTQSKRTALAEVAEQLGHILSDGMKVLELGAFKHEPGPGFGTSAARQFDILAQNIRVQEKIVRACNHGLPDHAECKGLLTKMDKLQKDGSRIASELLKANNPKKFKATLLRLEKTIQKIKQLLKHTE